MLLKVVALEQQLLVLNVELTQERLVLLSQVRARCRGNARGTLLLLETGGGERLGERSSLMDS